MVFGTGRDEAVLERGTSWEPRLVSRRQEIVEMYSRLLLVRLRARVDRLAALEVECRRRATAATFPRAALAALRQLAAGRDPMRLVRAMSWVFATGRRRQFRRTHILAAKLAAAARTTVIEAGAARDPVTRTRLLAATRYQATRDALDFALGDPSLAGPPDRLLAELDWLDTNLPPKEGRS
ncbi:hypothetical protein HNP84_000062 [Thermocatellispora tengchongensis]|uniref:Uncharacterized protein n=1 Tax=Thermocatellispora tengchongensis TaxID=1073253 RepID=A0A840NPC6_9ACTN|nr:hypothetical protein [Thermocatellispora tengchongensis]MBB5130374.1 hypothetical protein [Thermocatellispora tengchongensis]